MEKITLSIIIPVYNVGDMLARCLESIISQIAFPTEIILVDDGSTDNSAEIAVNYSNKYKDIVKYYHKKNGGLSSARNCGIEKACGEYLSFVDSDDYLESNFFIILKPLFEKGYDIIRFNFNKISNGNKINDKEQVYDNLETLKSNLLCDNIGSQVCKNIFRRSLVENHRFKDGVLYEDLYWTHEIYFKTDKIICISDCLYNYVMREGSISHSKNKQKIANDVFYAFIERLSFAKKIGNSNAEEVLIVKTIKHALSNMLYAPRKSPSYQDSKCFIKQHKKSYKEKNFRFVLIYYFNNVARLLNSFKRSN